MLIADMNYDNSVKISPCEKNNGKNVNFYSMNNFQYFTDENVTRKMRHNIIIF